MSLVESQVELLKTESAEALADRLADGSHVVTVPNIHLPPGWSVPNTTVKFLTLPNYPHSAPDCFWIEPHVRLQSGAMPKNTNVQLIPGTSLNWLWFSWHVGKWNPNRDSLFTFFKVIQDRLSKPQ